MIGLKANRQIKKLISSTGYFCTKYNLIIESNNTNIVYPEKPNIKPKTLLFSKLYFIIVTTTNYEEYNSKSTIFHCYIEVFLSL